MFPACVDEFGLLDASMERLMSSTSWKLTLFKTTVDNSDC